MHRVLETDTFHAEIKAENSTYKLFGIWIPLSHEVNDWPLALCDGSSVSLENDLVETGIIRTSYQGANMYMIYREEHKWYFLHKQQIDEVLTFKQFDASSVEAACTYNILIGNLQKILIWLGENRLSSLFVLSK